MFLPELKSKIGEDISILLRLDNHTSSYICECGVASELTMKDCHNTEGIFISHTHIDHFINFDQILRHQIGLKKRVIICGPNGIIDQLQSKIKGYTWNLIERGSITYEIREVVNEQLVNKYELEPPNWEITKIGPIDGSKIFANERFSVSYTILDHKVPSIAYLFKETDSVKIDLSGSGYRGGSWVRHLKLAFENETKNEEIEIEGKKYHASELFHLLKIKEGDSVGVIMDHAANMDNHNKIKSLFTNCNKVFIESFYKESDKKSAEINYHSYSRESGKIMKECEVKEAIPVHFSRKYEEEEIEILIKEFEEEYKI